MPSNQGVAYMGTGKVEVQSIDFPKLELREQSGTDKDVRAFLDEVLKGMSE